MKRPQDLVFRILAHPLRLLSLRSIVILAQLGVIILVLTLGVWVWVGVTQDQYDQLDRRLDSLS
ncbi:MAG: two-component sensor histidine kinase, partial [Mycobacterium sp.]